MYYIVQYVQYFLFFSMTIKNHLWLFLLVFSYSSESGKIDVIIFFTGSLFPHYNVVLPLIILCGKIALERKGLYSLSYFYLVKSQVWLTYIP